jgi:hypothetical protein
MKNGYLKKIGTTFLLTPALLLATLPAGAQELHRRGDDHDRGRTQQRYDAHRDYRPVYGHNDYRGAGYVTYGPAYPATGYYVHDDGIGPGKGAAIGAVGGAVLGALVGGGKGAVIGGAAGAGVGAIAGQAAQDNRRYGY